MNWIKIEFALALKLGISPLDLRELEFYEIEYLIKELEEYTEEENKRNRAQEKEYSKSSGKSPSAPAFKQPKMEMPKFNMPKF